MKTLFVDTGAFLARELARDQYHHQALRAWDEVRTKGWKLASTEHVLDECSTLLARRTSYAWASEWGIDVLDSGVQWLKAEEADLKKAFTVMRKYADQGVSYTDSVSFVVMKRLGMRTAFGFDRHFEAAGLRLYPKN